MIVECEYLSGNGSVVAERKNDLRPHAARSPRGLLLYVIYLSDLPGFREAIPGSSFVCIFFASGMHI